jgi:hypothetical protein
MYRRTCRCGVAETEKQLMPFRDRMAKELRIHLTVHANLEGLKMNTNPLIPGSTIQADIIKQQELKRRSIRPLSEAVFDRVPRDESDLLGEGAIRVNS